MITWLTYWPVLLTPTVILSGGNCWDNAVMVALLLESEDGAGVAA